ncbi:hypothetical protein Ahy_A03g014708 [Arachis hypogaea]|uniref:FAR1 domain-containing protein n=1 Tax=Arachis hypogaea TaxID=3818 RepID=A0A445DYL7_ARAHY|nr:hypothetical protein Ahy_A03g014708 [Arachis hypogaea]
MASPAPSMERRYPLTAVVFGENSPILRVSLNYRIVAVWHRVAEDEDTTGGVRVADEAEMSDEADHGVGSVEGERSAGMESDENDFQEDDTEHDHHAEADVDNGILDGAGGMSENYAEDEFYAVDSGESIGWIDFLNLSAEDVLRFNFADVDIAFEFYQQYAKHHGFGVRRSRSEKCGEVRIRQEFVCHRQGFRSPKFYSMPNRQKRPRHGVDALQGCYSAWTMNQDVGTLRSFQTRITTTFLSCDFLPCSRAIGG